MILVSSVESSSQQIGKPNNASKKNVSSKVHQLDAYRDIIRALYEEGSLDDVMQIMEFCYGIKHTQVDPNC